MQEEELIHPVYLPFTASQLRQHFAPVARRTEEQLSNHIAYYVKSATRYRDFCLAYPDRNCLRLADLRIPCQIEKDERFWAAACWLRLYYAPDRVSLLCQIMSACFGPRPPIEGFGDWSECFRGKLYLFLEPRLPSPHAYRTWLAAHIRERNLIPYVLAVGARGGDAFETATHVDVLLLNECNGFAVLIEAKVMSDVSLDVSFDVLRNQLARTIDVAQEQNSSLLPPLRSRIPSKTLVVLQTPELFKSNPSSRLYGWLFNEYSRSPDALARDLPHRKELDWKAISTRLGWLTWENCNHCLAGSCQWLDTSR
jgi:hypothetical protein